MVAFGYQFRKGGFVNRLPTMGWVNVMSPVMPVMPCTYDGRHFFFRNNTAMKSAKVCIDCFLSSTRVLLLYLVSGV